MICENFAYKHKFVILNASVYVVEMQKQGHCYCSDISR